MKTDQKYAFETKMIHAGYEGDETHSVVPPLFQTNAYYYDSVEHAQSLFELKEAGNIYTRITNPTNAFFEERVAALDGGVGALAFSSGHAAMFNAIVNLCCVGDEVVSSCNIYGGAVNMFGVSLKRLGITVRFVDPDDLSAWGAAVSDKTKLFFTELIGNPHANVSDIEGIAEIAHKNGIPFMVDGTFCSPYLCRPLEFGADYVVHSATKFLSGHGQVMAGVIVDGGSFSFKDNPRFPLFNQPDVSYHGVVFADTGAAAFILRLRALIMRDLGSCLAPFNSFLIMQGIETLSLRMERHCENALKIAEFLEGNEQVERVNYPSLKSSKYYALAKKYMPKGASSVFSFRIVGGKERAAKFIDSLCLIQNVSNLGDIRTQISHPATTTHSQMSAEQLKASGIDGGDIRISVGLENIDDLINDMKNAFRSCIQ
ncbi:MAG: O-acetylhomoserine aminocarboxypropyltransferase/cysteine synthase [Oscillospiraceae bacterium]|nr:O-acetylhomoserine aminocarboxypropyltransferase/cysteine synthase [Oscillospiraceae bacterium]